MLKLKTILLASALLLPVMRLFGAVTVEAPVTIAITVTSNDPVLSGSTLTAKQSVTKLTTADILKECVRRKLITSTKGWSIVCYYDSTMDGIYTKTDPVFRLRNTSGATASIGDVLTLTSTATAVGGKASVTSSKVTGTLTERALYNLRVRYQSYLAICSGAASVKLVLSGKKSAYYGTAGATKGVFAGYLDKDYESVVDVALTIGAFKKR